MADFQSYLESTNERLQADLRGSDYIPPIPMLPPDMSDTSQLGFGMESGYNSGPSSAEQAIAQLRASRRYAEVQARQNRRDLWLDVGKDAASLLVGSRLGFLGYMGTSFLFDQAYDMFGLKDPMEVYTQQDYIRSQMAGSIDAFSNRFMSGFQFGQRGLTMDQSSELAKILLPSMRDQGFQGLELERMMPMLASSGVLNMSGSFSSADEAVEALGQKIENLTGRIAEAVKKSSLTIEEATSFVIREHQLSGGAMLAGNDNTLFSSMNLVSNATGMSYNDSMQFMTGTLGAWAGTSGNLLPFMESAAIGAAAGQATYMNSPWATAWDRAGGVAAVAGGYASAGNAYWMQRRQITRLGQMYAGGVLTDETMYDLAAGGSYSDLDLDAISNVNDRYEAEFYGRQALARNPVAAQAAAFGDTVRQMEDAGANSRIARAGWLMRHRGMSESAALAYLDQHYAVSTESGRFAGYVGGLRSNIVNQREDIGEAFDQAFEDWTYLSGEHDQYWGSHIMNLYNDRTYTDSEGNEVTINAGGYLDYIRQNLEDNATIFGREGGATSGFFGRRGSTSVQDASGRMNITGLGSAFESQLSQRGLNSSGVGGRAVLGMLSGLSYEEAKNIRLNRGGGEYDVRLVDILGQSDWQKFSGMANAYSDWWGMEWNVRDNQGGWEAFLAMSESEQGEFLRSLGVDYSGTGTGDSLYTTDATTRNALRGSWSDWFTSPEIEAQIMYGMTSNQANAWQSIYAGGQRQQAVQGAMVSMIESGDAGRIFGQFGSGSTEQRRELDRMTSTLSALESVSASPLNLAVDPGTRGSYQAFVDKLSEEGYGMRDATTGLSHRDADSHLEVRNRLAESGYGMTWSELDSAQQDIINEYMYNNDSTGRYGEGNWGGRQTDVIGTLRENIGDTAEGIINANRDAVMGGGGKRFMGRLQGVVAGDNFSSINIEDVSAFGSAQLALSTGNTAEYEAIMSQFSTQQAQELRNLDLQMGAYGSGLTMEQQYATMAYASYDAAMSGIVSASGLTGDQATAFRTALESQDMTALANFGYSGQNAGAFQDYAAGKIDLTELVKRTGIELTEGQADDIREADQLAGVARNMERGIQTVSIAEDSPPLPITTGEGSISVRVVEGGEE